MAAFFFVAAAAFAPGDFGHEFVVPVFSFRVQHGFVGYDEGAVEFFDAECALGLPVEDVEREAELAKVAQEALGGEAHVTAVYLFVYFAQDVKAEFAVFKELFPTHDEHVAEVLHRAVLQLGYGGGVLRVEAFGGGDEAVEDGGVLLWQRRILCAHIGLPQVRHVVGLEHDAIAVCQRGLYVSLGNVLQVVRGDVRHEVHAAARQPDAIRVSLPAVEHEVPPVVHEADDLRRPELVIIFPRPILRGELAVFVILRRDVLPIIIPQHAVKQLRCPGTPRLDGQ